MGSYNEGWGGNWLVSAVSGKTDELRSRRRNFAKKIAENCSFPAKSVAKSVFLLKFSFLKTVFLLKIRENASFSGLLCTALI